MNTEMLKIENLKFSYEENFKLIIEKPLVFRKGKLYSLVGPNGSGKSTFLKIIGGIINPSAGLIYFKGREISKGNLLSYRKSIGIVFEDPYIFKCRVIENIKMGLKYRDNHLTVKEKLYKAKMALEAVGLNGYENKFGNELSQGEKKRLGIARAIISMPELLILDEPFANIDKQAGSSLERLLLSYVEENKTTIIFSSHDMHKAYYLTDEVITLINGGVVQGMPDNILRGKAIEKDGKSVVKLSDGVEINVVTETRGDIVINIPSNDIIIALEQDITSSARNVFKGKVSKIDIKYKLAYIGVQISEDIELFSLITKESFGRLGLEIDKEVYLIFKSTSVQLV